MIAPIFGILILAANLPRFTFTVSQPPSLALPMTATAIATDSGGNVYLAGTVAGSPFTATPGAVQSQGMGGTCARGGGLVPIFFQCANAFVIKLDATGAVVFATYLGGTGNAKPSAIALDSEGNVYVAGTVTAGGTTSAGFPVTSGAAFSSANGTYGFIAKLNPSATQLEYLTLVPGASLVGIALDSAGDVYFAGSYLNDGRSPFPATAGAYQPAPLASQAAIVGELNPAGSALVYGTYLSGTQLGSVGAAISVDSEGNAIVAGTDSDADFPATTGTFSTAYLGLQNVFLAKLNPGGSKLIYASLLGPAMANAMKVDASGNVYIGVESSGFPVTSAPFGTVPSSGPYNDYLLKVSTDGSTVLSSITLPFSGNLGTWGMDLDAAGNLYVAGSAENGSVAATTGAFQSSFAGGGSDAVIAKITPGGQIAGMTYFGGAGADSASAIAVHQDGSVVVAGETSNSDGSAIFFAANLFPAITLGNSASLMASPAVPGALVTIQGYGLGPAQGVASSPVSALAGVQVYFDNFVAPITYAQAGQINVQAPWEIAGQTSTQMRIVFNGAQAGGATLPVGQALPGVFFINNSDGSRNSPSNPAALGDFVTVYGTGGGATNGPGVTGGTWPLVPLAFLTQPVSVTVGGENAAPVLYAGSAPTLSSGFFQINVRLSLDLTAPSQFLNVTIGGVTSAPVAISVE